MVIGIGTDIIRINKLGPSRLKHGEAFLHRTYTPTEIEEGSKRNNPRTYFAVRFCGKEAVFKALQIASDIARFTETEILSEETGGPYVKLYGQTAKVAASKGITNIQISLSWDDDYAVAYAIAQTGTEVI